MYTQSVHRKTCLVTLLLLLFSNTSFSQTTQSDLSLKIWPKSAKVVKGETVVIYVEISNHGRKDLFISRRLPSIQGDGAFLCFHVFDRGNVESPRAMGVSDQFASHGVSLPLAVLSNWIALPPNSTYRVEREIGASEFDFLGELGTYRISASYISLGIRGQVSSWHLVDVKPEDVDRLPFQAWEGTLESNPIWIKVVK